MKVKKRSLHKYNGKEERAQQLKLEKLERKQRAADRITYLESISESLSLSPDIVAGGPIITLRGRTACVIENYKRILEYSENLIRIQTRVFYIMIEGSELKIAYFTKDEMKITGIIRGLTYS